MKKTMIAGAVVAALTMTTGVFAKEGNYFGFGATQHSVDAPDFEFDSMTIDGKIGTYFNENFSGELRVGLAATDDSFFGVDLEVKNYYGAYLRAGLPATDAFYPYAIVGYTKTKVEASGFGETVSDSESDMSYGFGADFSLTNDMDLSVEYMRYLDKDGGEIDGIGLGIKFKF
ncbi:porin family protein [Kangiella aquimarina]|uniref:Porin family protein n=1 Tax=Kangiella aquimarina TaxID=261965 RepID=A0ABZ0X321_9GAMM|nr:porin family protein [Kangiella aquimarina]WQG84958.1 porin family protein [Kangiella aquimarina]